uniref:Uncharacterized protein n=1 Tax=Pelusios castaneus TaxID=367368 RepID=A0A8C8SZP2_9SAUR
MKRASKEPVTVIFFPLSSILGIKAIEPPEVLTFSVPPLFAAAWTTEAPPALLGAESAAVPEEDRDHLYHPPDDTLEGDAPRETVVLYEEVISGPEEDRDHLYHD